MPASLTRIRAAYAAFVSCVVALSLATPLAAQQKIARGWPAAPGAAVRIHNLNGSVRVIGWDRDSVAVSGHAERDAGGFFGGGSRQALKLGVWNEAPGDTGRVVIEVRVPVTSQVWVKTAAASIDVSGIRGTLDLNTVTGDVKVTGAARDVSVESIGGSIYVEADARTVRARSGSGTVTVRGNAADATLSTVSGPVHASAASFERARLESVSGDVSFQGALAPGAALELQTHSGRIDVALPPSTAAEFTISTLKGKVRNDFGPSAAKSGDIAFATGDARATLIVRTFSGAVSLRRVDPAGKT